MVWFVITILVMVILIINDKFNHVMKLIDENDLRYSSRFTDVELRIAKTEK